MTVYRLRKRPFLVRFRNHYRTYREVGFSMLKAARVALAMAIF